MDDRRKEDQGEFGKLRPVVILPANEMPEVNPLPLSVYPLKSPVC